MKYIIKEYEDLHEKVKSLSNQELLKCVVCPNITLNSDEVVKDTPCVFIHPTTIDRAKVLASKINDGRENKALIVSDMEAGAGTAIVGATMFPSIRAISEAGSVSLAYEMGKIAAVEARKAGYHWTFGPCVDILGNHQSPIMGIRSAGESKDVVLKYTKAYMQGLQDFGLIATLKHFPGDGYCVNDQHLTTAVNPLSKKEWNQSFRPLYVDLINNGAMAIMPGHISLPAYDEKADNGIYPPATLSYNLLTKLLKEDLGFSGIIISDATEMSGFCGFINYYDACARFLMAGGDCLLFTHPDATFIAKMLGFIEQGILTREVLINRAYRMLAFAREYFTKEDKELPILVGQDVADEVVRRSCKIFRDRQKVLPILVKKGMKVAHIVIANQYNFKATEELTAKLKEILSVDEFVDPGSQKCKQIAISGEYDLIVCSLGSFPWYGTNQIKLAGVVARNMMNGWSKYDTPVVFVDFGNPYIHEEYDAVIDTLIYTYGYAKATVDEVIKKIFMMV